MKKGILISTLLLLSMGKLLAQLNESDTVKLQLRAGLTGAYQQGNVEVLTIKSKLEFSLMPHKNWVLKSQNSSLYQSFYGTEADNDVFSRNYLYFKPQNKLYAFAIAYVSGNFRRKIDNRYFAGAGATYQIINTGKNVIKLSASAVYENTHFKANTYNYTEYNGQDNISLWRGTLYVGAWHYLFDKHIRLYYDAYWQPAFNQNNNYRIQVETGLDFPIWKGLSFNALYVYTHENLVVANIKQDDSIITFGLAYNLKTK